MMIEYVLSQEDAYRHAKEYMAFLGFGRVVEIEKVSSNGILSYYISSFNNNSYSRSLTVMSVRDFLHLIKNNMMLLDDDIISVEYLVGENERFIVKKNIVKVRKNKDNKIVKRFTKIFKSV